MITPGKVKFYTQRDRAYGGKKGGLASLFPHSHAPRGNAVWARCAGGGQKAGLKTRTTFLYGTAPPVAAKTQ